LGGRRRTVPTMVVRAILARCSAGSSLTWLELRVRVRVRVRVSLRVRVRVRLG
jgi:hypothetical protein